MAARVSIAGVPSTKGSVLKLDESPKTDEVGLLWMPLSASDDGVGVGVRVDTGSDGVDGNVAVASGIAAGTLETSGWLSSKTSAHLNGHFCGIFGRKKGPSKGREK
eukprot:TRINITY_DN54707_c0_g1_i1.p2 TRINITY_DN54707_c0_g1~~TRINITY_DN54707_c0_g1_i1.p2  ORF type:complete len:106 (-),score=19.73 TRINITY_DN54707_c0_g1_i1:47-364(-)